MPRLTDLKMGSQQIDACDSCGVVTATGPMADSMICCDCFEEWCFDCGDRTGLWHADARRFSCAVCGREWDLDEVIGVWPSL